MFLYSGDLRVDTTADLLSVNIPIDLSTKLTNLELAHYRHRRSSHHAPFSARQLSAQAIVAHHDIEEWIFEVVAAQ